MGGGGGGGGPELFPCPYPPSTEGSGTPTTRPKTDNPV